ncbi:MAG TPA: tetratricopeptide repeat protein [Clostridiaceae bacterium]
MICYNCGYSLPSKDNKTCPLCGMNMPILCQGCGSRNSIHGKYCFNCGKKLSYVKEASLIKNYEVLGENRKDIAVIFADVSGFTSLSEKLDPEEVREIINQCFDYITRPVYEMEGTIDKYIGDCVMILFGAKYVHIDDGKRAVRCALRMMELADRFSKERLFDKGIKVSLSIGVNYGLVVTGSVGNLYDKDYTVIGDVVNTAQRLQSSAGRGNILVSQACYLETKDNIKYSEKILIEVKNKSVALSCYNALEAKEEEVSLIFERDKELSLVEKSFQSGEGYVNIVGEAGIGKTLLCKRFIEKTSKDIIKLWVDGSLQYKNKANYLIEKLIFQIVSINPEDSMDVKKSKLVAFINYVLMNRTKGEREKNYNFLSLVLKLQRDTEFTAILNFMQYKDIKQETDNQLNIFFTDLCREPYIFIIDDLQWADASSLELLKNILINSKTDNFFILISHHAIFDKIINLNNLNRQGIKSIICSIFQVKDAEENLINDLEELSSGNPLYIKEIGYGLYRSGSYTVKENTLYMQEEGLSKFHVGVEKLILSSFSNLSEESQKFLLSAAVIGKEFNISWVSELTAGQFDLQEIIRELSEHNIISLKTAYTSFGIINRIYIFKQTLTRDAIYNSLLNRDKKSYSKKVGELIEKRYADNIEEHYTEAFSYFILSSSGKAFEYALKAAISFKDSYNIKEALEYYQIFVDGRINDNRIAQAYRDMGSLRSILLENDKAIECYNKALALLDYSEDIYEVRLTLSEIDKEMGSYEAAIKIIGELKPKIRENSGLYGRLLYLECSILSLQGQEGALEVAIKAQEILKKTKDYVNLAMTENEIGIQYFLMGDIDNATYYLNSAYANIEKTNNLKIKNSIVSNLGAVYHASGRISKALEALNNALKISNDISDVKSFIAGSTNLGVLYYDKGLYQKAEQLFSIALEKSKKTSQIYFSCILSFNMGDINYERGEYKQAAELYEQALKIAKKHEMPDEEAISYINLGKVSIKQGLIEEAEELFKKGFDILEELKDATGLIDYYRYMSEISILKDKINFAKEFCSLALDCAQEAQSQIQTLRCSILMGDILAMQGSFKESENYFKEGIKLGKELESDIETGIAYYGRAKIYERMGDLLNKEEDIKEAKDCIIKVDDSVWKRTINNL